MIGILGTGRAVPEHVMTNDELSRIVDTSDEWIVSHTGISSRYIAQGETALSLSMDAARQALQAANVEPQELGLIVCATFTTDHLTPSLSCEVLNALGASCPAFDINAACSGFLYGVTAAMAMSPDKPSLVIGCELLSRVTDYTDRSTCILFGDGAGAAVLGVTQGRGEILSHHLMAYPDTKKSLNCAGVNQGSPRSYLEMNGTEVYKFATRALAHDIEQTVSGLGLTTDNIDWFVPHQANIRIIQTAAKLLKIPMERFWVNIQRMGNTSAASVPIALDELLRTSRPQPGELIMLSAFGGGLTSGTLVFRY